MTKLYVLEPSDYKSDAGYSVATAADLIAALSANDEAREALRAALLPMADARQEATETRAEAAEAKVAELAELERKLGADKASLQSQFRDLEQECQRLRGQLEAAGSIAPGQCGQLLTDGQTTCGRCIRMAHDTGPCWLEEPRQEFRHHAFTLMRRDGGYSCEHCGMPETYRLPCSALVATSPIQPPPVPQVAEASANPWADNTHVCTDCHHSDTSHGRSGGICVECDCQEFRYEAPAQGEREKLAGGDYVTRVELMEVVTKALGRCDATDDSYYALRFLADELERAAKERA